MTTRKNALKASTAATAEQPAIEAATPNPFLSVMTGEEWQNLLMAIDTQIKQGGTAAALVFAPIAVKIVNGVNQQG